MSSVKGKILKTSTDVNEFNGVWLKKENQYSREELIKCADSFMGLIPGISDILFYYSLLPIVTTFLEKVRSYPDFILVLTGRRGNFKTTLARMVVLVLKQEELQELKFFRTPSLNLIEERMNALVGMNLLIDDIFPASGQYQRAKQSDLLNQLSRFGDKRLYKAGLIITAERMPEQLILSGRDRIFQLSIPDMCSDRKMKLWNECKKIPEDFMACLAESLKKCLSERSDEVIGDITQFIQQYKLPEGLTMETRIGVHAEYIELTEFLYRKYFCNEKRECQIMEQFTGRLYATSIRQHNEICKAEFEQELNYVLEVYQMMTAENRYLKMEGHYNDYKPKGNNFLIWNGRYYITSEALQYGMQIYLKHTVSLKKISRALCDAGVLETNSGDARTKKCGLGVRHYVISRYAIEMYCSETVGVKST